MSFWYEIKEGQLRFSERGKQLVNSGDKIPNPKILCR